jgi:hypothetical protein
MRPGSGLPRMRCQATRVDAAPDGSSSLPASPCRPQADVTRSANVPTWAGSLKRPRSHFGHPSGPPAKWAVWPGGFTGPGGPSAGLLPCRDCVGELGACLDFEFPVDVGEVCFDCFRGDEECLGDFAVGLSFCCHLRDSAFAWGEGVDAGAVRRRGRAPVARSSAWARSARTIARQLWASSSPSWRKVRAEARWFARRSAAPSSVNDLARSSCACDVASTETDSRRSSSPSSQGQRRNEKAPRVQGFPDGRGAEI